MGALKLWPEEERPRERLQTIGSQYLKTEELFAILLGSGGPGKTAIDLATTIWETYDRSLYNLIRNSSIEQLIQIPGIGPSKAISIIAALEIGKRIQVEAAPIQKTVNSAEDAYSELKGKLMYLNHEEFWVLFLNRGNGIITKECLSKGGLTGTIADRRIIFKRALELGCAAILIAHNHPSGNLKPSKADLALTQDIVRMGNVMDIHVLDHIIVTASSYYSLREHNQL